MDRSAAFKTSTAFDVAMMRRALFYAARGQGRTTPNPMVGAIVLSSDGVIVGQGWHARAGEPHAEAHALEEAGSRARGGTIYVNLEPCCHVGRTGPCTRRIVDAGIRRVVAAMTDPDPRVSGQGFAELRANGIAVETGLMASEAARLNAAFVTVKRSERPLVLLKAATSLDARVAAQAGVRTQLTSQAANIRAQCLRAAVDAIAVGSETVRVDDPLLTARAVHRVRPLVRVVFDRRLRTSPKARLFSTLSEGPVIIVTDGRNGGSASRAHAIEAAGGLTLVAESLGESLRALLAWDISTLLVEGGPQLQAAFWEAGVVDRLHLVVAPRVLGPAGVPWLGPDVIPRVAWADLVVEPRGPDTWIEADVHRDR
jgi:diaminohydroxyphosphoribosylaminopyrimidine deaminase/5-amino-6-(5-phosphoribosylamino)uracil reductase